MDYQTRKLRRSAPGTESVSRKLANFNRRFPTSLKPCITLYPAEYWEYKANALEVAAQAADPWTSDMVGWMDLEGPMVTGGYMDYLSFECDNGDVHEELLDLEYFLP